MDFFLKRCHKPLFACSTVSSYNIRYTDWEKTCPKGVLLKKIFPSFLRQKVWRFGGFPHIYVQIYRYLRRNPKCAFEKNFSSTPSRFFSLFVVYIREIRSWTVSIEWYTFSRTTSYFLRKCQKKPFSSNFSH